MINIFNNKINLLNLKIEQTYSSHIGASLSSLPYQREKEVGLLTNLKKRKNKFCKFSYTLNKISKNYPALTSKAIPYLIRDFSVKEIENIFTMSPLSQKGFNLLKEIPKNSYSILYPHKIKNTLPIPSIPKASYPKGEGWGGVRSQKEDSNTGNFTILPNSPKSAVESKLNHKFKIKIINPTPNPNTIFPPFSLHQTGEVGKGWSFDHFDTKREGIPYWVNGKKFSNPLSLSRKFKIYNLFTKASLIEFGGIRSLVSSAPSSEFLSNSNNSNKTNTENKPKSSNTTNGINPSKTTSSSKTKKFIYFNKKKLSGRLLYLKYKKENLKNKSNLEEIISSTDSIITPIKTPLKSKFDSEQAHRTNITKYSNLQNRRLLKSNTDNISENTGSFSLFPTYHQNEKGKGEKILVVKDLFDSSFNKNPMDNSDVNKKNKTPINKTVDTVSQIEVPLSYHLEEDRYTKSTRGSSLSPKGERNNNLKKKGFKEVRASVNRFEREANNKTKDDRKKKANLYFTRFRGSIDWGENSKKGKKFKSLYEYENEKIFKRDKKQLGQLLKDWGVNWTNRKLYFKKLSNYNFNTSPESLDLSFFRNMNEIRNLINSKYCFNTLLTSSQSVNYSFNKSKNGLIDLNSIYKILKYFFSSLSALISKPIISFSSEKVHIQLFYFIIPKIKNLKKERKLKYLIRKRLKLVKDQQNKNVFNKIMTKFKIKEFLARWKESENLVRLPELPDTFLNISRSLHHPAPISKGSGAVERGGWGEINQNTNIKVSRGIKGDKTEGLFNLNKGKLIYLNLLQIRFNQLSQLILTNNKSENELETNQNLSIFSNLSATFSEGLEHTLTHSHPSLLGKGACGMERGETNIKSKLKKIIRGKVDSELIENQIVKPKTLLSQNENVDMEEYSENFTSLGKLSSKSSLIELAKNEKFINGFNSLQLLKLRKTFTMLSLNERISQYLVFILEKLFKKDVEVEVKRLKYPYHDSNILSQILNNSSNQTTFRNMMKKLFYTAIIKNPTNMISKQDFSIIPSFLSGIKVRLAGRIATQRIIPRFTVQSFQMGSLARGKVDYVNTSRISHKNKRGAYTFTVTTSHFFKNKKIKR